MIEQGLHTLGMTFATHGSFWEVLADVGRRARVPRRPPLQPWRHWSGHQLGFLGCPFGCTALLGSSDVAQDRRPTEKQAPTGKLAGFSALGTHKAGRSASESWCGRAGRSYTARLAMIATVISKSVETDHVIAYVTNLEQYGLHALRA